MGKWKNGKTWKMEESNVKCENGNAGKSFAEQKVANQLGQLHRVLLCTGWPCSTVGNSKEFLMHIL